MGIFFAATGERFRKGTRQQNEQVQILLAMKKRGFGVGKWNGPGGKQDKGDKDILATARRECQEEVGVNPTDLVQKGSILFLFPHQPSWNTHCCIFSGKSWEGEVAESEEMRPQWFNISDIPYHSMWDDDSLWLPELIDGEEVHWTFWFDEAGKVLKALRSLYDGEDFQKEVSTQ